MWSVGQPVLTGTTVIFFQFSKAYFCDHPQKHGLKRVIWDAQSSVLVSEFLSCFYSHLCTDAIRISSVTLNVLMMENVMLVRVTNEGQETQKNIPAQCPLVGCKQGMISLICLEVSSRNKTQSFVLVSF